MTNPQALEEEEARLAARLVAEICPVMAAHPPEVQGAALADLLAIWLAGHIVPDNPSETAKLRGELLRMHIGMVRTLIPIHEGMIAARLKKAGARGDDRDTGNGRSGDRSHRVGSGLQQALQPDYLRWAD